MAIENYKIIFKDRDGNLLLDKISDNLDFVYYFHRVDEKFLGMYANTLAREKGVKIISRADRKDSKTLTFEYVVEYLGKAK